MCYGAVVPDGYGAAYNPHADYIVTVVTCFKDDAETSAEQFSALLEASLLEMHDLVTANPELARQKSPEPTTWTIPEEIAGMQD
ncbi:unnamed protein product [Dibothriocephalus latus]|uniref:Choline/carnitine acyltransferase domain-containing protein n=1 Tax=Dibothriocephalus latus TaxID=60516 RepID=A0A3P7MEW0_DIBLA|nr:unnamed protein product [Dibothriocephalus latus]